MNGVTKPWPLMSLEEKIEFFVQCQSLLLTHHKDSEFVTTERNVSARIKHCKEMVGSYKGFCYADDKVCVLFNKVKVNDPNAPVETLRAHTFQDPNPEYNAVSVDFVVFRELQDCIEWVKKNYEPRLQFVIYVKGGKPKVYQTQRLLTNVFSIPNGAAT